MRYWSTPAWTDPALASRVIERDRSSSEDDESIRFGLFERGTQNPVGCCSVHHFTGATGARKSATSSGARTGVAG